MPVQRMLLALATGVLMALTVGVGGRPSEPVSATGPIDITGEWIIELSGDATGTCFVTSVQMLSETKSADVTGSGSCISPTQYPLVDPSTINQTTGDFTITSSGGFTFTGTASKDGNSASGTWVYGPVSGTFTADRAIDVAGEWIIDLTGDVTDSCRVTIAQTFTKTKSADLSGPGNCAGMGAFTLIAPSTINQTTGEFTITNSGGLTLTGTVTTDRNSASGTWVNGPLSGTFTADRVIDVAGEWIFDLTGDLTDSCRVTIAETFTKTKAADLTGPGNCAGMGAFTLIVPSTINQTTGDFTITNSAGLTLTGTASQDGNSAGGGWVAGPSSGSFTAAKVIDISGSWAASYTHIDPAPEFSSTCSFTPEAIPGGGFTQGFSKVETATLTADGMCGLAEIHLSGTINQRTGVFSMTTAPGEAWLEASGTAANGGATSSGVYSSNLSSGTFTAARIVGSTSSAIVAAAGGSVDTGSGDPVEADLAIGPGALNADTTVTVEVWSSSAAPDLETFLPGVPTAAGVGDIAGFVFNLLPEGTVLNPPFAEVTFTYTDEAVEGVDENALGVIHFVGDEWVSATILDRDTVANTITAQIDSFSLWASYVPAVDDTDSDGCDDVAEFGPSENLGGQRDPLDFWDFYDTPTDNPLARDKSVSGKDFFAVLGRFNAMDGGPGDFDRDSDPLSTPNPALPGQNRANYHPAYDHAGGYPAGAFGTTPPDGSISGLDFFAVLAQFNHQCS